MKSAARRRLVGRRSASSDGELRAIASTSARTTASCTRPPTAVDQRYRICGSGFPAPIRDPYPTSARTPTRTSHCARRFVSALPWGGAVPKRLFTPSEANSALVQVRPIAERLVALRARMRELAAAQGQLVTDIGGNGGGYAASDL